MKNIHYRRFPGDTIVVPMVIGIILNSLVPSFLTPWFTAQIAKHQKNSVKAADKPAEA